MSRQHRYFDASQLLPNRPYMSAIIKRTIYHIVKILKCSSFTDEPNTFSGMATIQEKVNNKLWQECGETGTPVHYWWACEMVQPLWKNNVEVSQKVQ